MSFDFINSNTPGSAGPPFPLNSAENGLSIDPITSRIVLGNDVAGISATLLSGREIPMNGFDFRMTDAGNLQFWVDPTIGVGLLSQPSVFLGIGAIGGGNNSMLQLADAAQNLLFTTNGGFRLDINGIAGTYQLGDISNIGNGAQLLIQDSGLAAFLFSSGTNYMAMSVDTTNRTARMGDLGNWGNQTVLEVDDINNEVDIRNTLLNAIVRINGSPGFTGTVTPVTTITVDGGIVTNVA